MLAIQITKWFKTNISIFCFQAIFLKLSKSASVHVWMNISYEFHDFHDKFSRCVKISLKSLRKYIRPIATLFWLSFNLKPVNIFSHQRAPYIPPFPFTFISRTSTLLKTAFDNRFYTRLYSRAFHICKFRAICQHLPTRHFVFTISFLWRTNRVARRLPLEDIQDPKTSTHPAPLQRYEHLSATSHISRCSD